MSTAIGLEPLEEFTNADDWRLTRCLRCGAEALSLALIPVATAIMILGGLTIGGTYLLGVYPVYGWARDSFEAAETWWSQTLIAMGAVVFTGLLGWLVVKLGSVLASTYRRW